MKAPGPDRFSYSFMVQNNSGGGYVSFGFHFNFLSILFNVLHLSFTLVIWVMIVVFIAVTVTAVANVAAATAVVVIVLVVVIVIFVLFVGVAHLVAFFAVIRFLLSRLCAKSLTSWTQVKMAASVKANLWSWHSASQINSDDDDDSSAMQRIG